MRLRPACTPHRKTYLIILLVASLGLVLIPSAWSGKLISLVQVLIPFQHAAAIAADAVGGTGDGAVDDDDAPVPRGTFNALEREKAALEHQVAALAVRVDELEREVSVLTATRLWEADSGRLGAKGRLVPADVITEDLLPWRSSRLVNAGTLRGIRRGSPATSREFVIDRGQAAGLDGGMAIVLGEVFVGLVEQVGTHAARVRLLSDVGVENKVRIGRFTEGGFAPIESHYWLMGRGNRVMEIRDAKRREVDAGLIRVGDVVLSDRTSSVLPAAMTIGKITAVAPDPDNPLHSILTVQSAVDESMLRRVYVYVPDAGPSDDDGPSGAAAP